MANKLEQLRNAHDKALGAQRRFFQHVGTATGSKAHDRFEHWSNEFDRLLDELASTLDKVPPIKP